MSKALKVFKTIDQIDDIITQTELIIKEKGVYEFIMDLNQAKFDDNFFKIKNLISDPKNRFFPTFDNPSSRFDCAKQLYKSLDGLTEIEANDPRLWTYASLFVYRDFILNDRKIDSSINKVNLYNYFFFYQPKCFKKY